MMLNRSHDIEFSKFDDEYPALQISKCSNSDGA